MTKIGNDSYAGSQQQQAAAGSRGFDFQPSQQSSGNSTSDGVQRSSWSMTNPPQTCRNVVDTAILVTMRLWQLLSNPQIAGDAQQPASWVLSVEAMASCHTNVYLEVWAYRHLRPGLLHAQQLGYPLRIKEAVMPAEQQGMEGAVARLRQLATLVPRTPWSAISDATAGLPASKFSSAIEATAEVCIRTPLLHLSALAYHSPASGFTEGHRQRVVQALGFGEELPSTCWSTTPTAGADSEGSNGCNNSSGNCESPSCSGAGSSGPACQDPCPPPAHVRGFVEQMLRKAVYPEFQHYPLMYLNTAAGGPASASLAELITRDLDMRLIRQGSSATEAHPENGSARVGTLRRHEQASSEQPFCHSCLAWLQAQLLGVLDEVLQQQQQQQAC
jgi:hypothetical protein